MHTETEPLRRQCGDLRLEGLEFLTDGGPAVDDEEHVAERIVGKLGVAGTLTPPVFGHRVDTVGPEGIFARPDDCEHFGECAPDQVRFQSAGHRADMR
ncbi:Uncharacterised protein [Mycobacteroides abscessus subsp. abscessus]|nr:Uncharacterised protein [Mycobacteroides abscessus subsp. abscessus]